MPERIEDGHEWVGAAVINVPTTVVRNAHTRGFMRLKSESKVSILEVYCTRCMKGYDRAVGKPCEAIESRDHLIGGPVGDQRRRREPETRVAFG